MKFTDVAGQILHDVHEHRHESHELFKDATGHGQAKTPHTCPGIEEPGSTGVIYVTDRAMANGFHYGAEDWSNLGQGAPEVGDIPGAHPKPKSLDLEKFGELIHEYAPTLGIPELRQKVADYYNATFREGQKSPYAMENVCIVPGGRAGLSRVAAVIGSVMTGFQTPEYTAYEALLGCFKSLIPIPTPLLESENYKMSIDALEHEVRTRGLSAVVMSNPRNPTGQLIEGDELKKLVESASRLGFTAVLDEFYSHYMLDGELGRAVSAASYIEDVNDDPVVLIDGLTKNWRCPGWRVCWVVGPRDVIKALNQSGSFLDGGASHVMQCMALQLMELDRIKQDRIALQKHFRMKRDHCLQRFEKMGLPVKVPPRATFYIWLSLSSLPAPLNSGLTMAEELLREKCIVTPGIFFDVNPSHRRRIVDSPCEPFLRISFGPSLAEIDRGLDAFERVLAKVRNVELGRRHSIGANYAKKDVTRDAANLHGVYNMGA